jgi:hypothetical protein
VPRLRLIACAVLRRELDVLLPRAPCGVDASFVPQGLHERPTELRRALQAEIDAVDAVESTAPVRYDAILLGVGLCGTGTVGLRSARHRLVLPRAHDCFTLALGCRHRFRRAFEAQPGTYWATAGWVANGALSGADARRRALVARHGPAATEALLEAEGRALARYDRCAYVAWPGLRDGTERALARREADARGWSFGVLRGDPALLVGLLAGDWDDRYLVVEPGAAIAPAYDDAVVVAS